MQPLVVMQHADANIMQSSGESIQQEYQLRFGQLAEYRKAVWQILCADYFSKLVARDAAILDVGAGWGEFINHIPAARKFAMDLNPETGRRLAGEVTFLQQDCSQPWPLADGSLDAVFTSNFLEHLPDKAALANTVTQAWRSLKPGGRIICLGPNIKYLPGAYWDFWDHFIPLTERSLAEVLTMQEFSIERCLPRFLPYSMSTGRTPPLMLVRLYLKLPVFWPLMGKQFLVVGRKPTVP